MSVKWNIPLLLAAGILVGTIPARADHFTSVIGLANLTNYQSALLVITDSPPETTFAIATHKWVKEGQDFEDAYPKDKHIHILINGIGTNGVVRARENNINLLYVPRDTNWLGTNVGTGLHLAQTDFDDALDLYADLSERTLLIHPDVKELLFNFSLAAQDKAEAIAPLKKALEDRGVRIIADGDKFTWVVPAGVTNLVLPSALPARPAARQPASTNTVNTLPSDSINFINVDLRQVLDVYQVLTAQKWVQDKPIPTNFTITFHNQTPLTKNETLRAFTVLLRWHGLKFVDVDDKTFTLAPIAPGE